MTHVVTIKNVKNTRGMEGQGFTCSVYIDGRRSCEAEDWGDGGSVFFRGASAADLQILRDVGVANVQADRERFSFMFNEQGELTSMTEIEAWAIHPLITQYFMDKQIRGWCKKKIVIQKAGAKPDEFLTISQAYSPALDAQLMARYPGAEIVNKRFL